MAILFQCNKCQHSAKVKEKYAGKRAACPQCGAPIQIPRSSMVIIDSADITQTSRQAACETVPVGHQPWNRYAGASVCVAILSLAMFQLGRMSVTQQSSNRDFELHNSSDQQANEIHQTEVAAKVPQNKLGSHQSSVVANTPNSTNEKNQVESSLIQNTDDALETIESTDSPEPSQPEVIVPEAEPLPENLDFQSLALAEPVTFMAISEDGRNLFFSHQNANLVSVYDVLKQKVIAELTTPAPCSILNRGGQTFVANVLDGTISVFAENDGAWVQVNELQVDKPRIIHLSAPSGRNFDGMILATCHGLDRQSSYHDCHIYKVDIQKDRCERISQASMATFSYDGRLVLTQSSFNLSPGGQPTAYVSKDFLSGEAEAFFRGGISRTPYLYQPYPGSYWFGTNMIFGGNPLDEIQNELGRFVIADELQKLVYAVDENKVTAHELNVAFKEVGRKRVSYPDNLAKHFDSIYQRVYRQRDYFLDRPVACTLGNQLNVFILNLKTGIVLSAKTQAFKQTPFNKEPDIKISEIRLPQVTHPDTKMSLNTSESNEVDHFEEITSQLPRYLPVGRKWIAQLELPDGVELQSMTLPQGCKLTDLATLEWTPEPDQFGQHQLKLLVKQNQSQSFLRPKIEVIHRELFDAADGDNSKIENVESIALELDRYQLTYGNAAASLLLLQGDTLRVLNKSGDKVEKTIQLPRRYEFVKERSDKYICVSSKPPVVDIVDRKNQLIISHIPIEIDSNIQEVIDLSLNPEQKISYVSVKVTGDLPRYVIVEVDEQQRVAKKSEMFGAWVEVSADGTRAYTGYRDIYQNGISFHVNPGWRLLTIPEYGNIDMLIEWDLKSHEPLQVLPEAGGNGKGIRISADEERIVYLSHVGYPIHSGNLTGISAKDFSQNRVRYNTKEIGSTSELAFHPKLPWLAVPGGKAAVVFHQETGEILKNKLLLTSKGVGDGKTEKILFSPDGSSLLFVCSTLDGKFICPVKLQLTQEEKDAPFPKRPQRPSGAVASTN